jgi:outer membrane lipoprotein SlyB
MRKGVTIAVAVLLALGGCANYRPIVDTKGVDMNRYEGDLRECQAYATQVDPASSAVAGAIFGAVLSAALAGIGGSRNYSVPRSAQAGALLGGTSGAAAGAEAQINIVRRCMAGRGYSVLQ